MGAHCYENFFSNKELIQIEKLVEDTEAHSFNDAYLPMTA